MEPRTCTTLDGYRLEAELHPAEPLPPRAGMVICHPHPQYGGSMRSIVVSALVQELPKRGVSCLRFNFRGVEASEGEWDAGDAERHDVVAAIDQLSLELAPSTPLILAGWSFGADVALSVRDPRIAAWLAIAPPLRWGHDGDATATDPRAKLFVLAEHDEVRGPGEIEADIRAWVNADDVIVPGASHFFIGRTDRLVAIAAGFVHRITSEAVG